MKGTKEKGETTMKQLKPTGETMNKAYEMLKQYTVEQLIEARDVEAPKRMRGVFLRTFQNQCTFTIERKLSGKW